MLRASALLVDTAAAEVAVGDETSEACAVACYGMWTGRRNERMSGGVRERIGLPL